MLFSVLLQKHRECAQNASVAEKREKCELVCHPLMAVPNLTLRCCHSSAWADAVLDRLPFKSEKEARAALDDCWAKLTAAGTLLQNYPTVTRELQSGCRPYGVDEIKPHVMFAVTAMVSM